MIRKFKYQINHFVSIQPRNISIEDLATSLRKEYNIPAHVFDHDRRLLNGDSYEIPEERLNSYADLLDVSVKALVEESIEQYSMK